jgi:hypothetical protein
MPALRPIGIDGAGADRVIGSQGPAGTDTLLVPVLTGFPAGTTQGETFVWSSDGHLYTFNGSAWVDNGQSTSGGSGIPTDYAIVDFGPTGAPEATVLVDDPNCDAKSLILAWSNPWGQETDRLKEEEAIEQLQCVVTDRISGSGFTIHVYPKIGTATGRFKIGWARMK